MATPAQSHSAYRAVECLGAGFCMAVGAGYGTGMGSQMQAMVWRDGSWRRLALPRVASSELSSVSCWSTRGCLAVGFRGDRPLVVRWDGTAWRGEKGAPSRPAGAVVRSASCWSAYRCMVVGWSDDGVYSEHWDGRRWARVTHVAQRGAYLHDVSCASASDCVAVGSTRDVLDPIALHWDGRSWRARRPPAPGGHGAPAAVSCWAPTGCMAIGDVSDEGRAPYAFRWNGRAWVRAAMPQPLRSRFDDVSCSSATACTTVGAHVLTENKDALAERWDGRAWTRQETADTVSSGMFGVSCWSATGCVGVGSYRPSSESEVGQGLVERWSPSG